MTQRNAKARTAQTKSGETVYINTLWEVEGGWEGYILNAKGVAVLIFIPGR